MSIPYIVSSLVGGTYSAGVKLHKHTARIHTTINMNDEVGVKIAMSRGTIFAFCITFNRLFGTCAPISMDVRQGTDDGLFMSVVYGVNKPYVDDEAPDEG